MPKFTEINDGFSCLVCGHPVPKSASTCRNHCTKCLHSIHIDDNPGDRANECRGILQPIDYELKSRKGVVLIFKCKKCGETKKNKALLDDKIEADDYDVVLALKKSEPR